MGLICDADGAGIVDGMRRHYKKSALIEAVIEFRIASPLSDKELEKAKVRFGKDFSKVEDLVEIEVSFGVRPSSKNTLVGHKITSSDAEEILQIRKNGISISRLPPYPGWDQYIERVKLRWGEFRKFSGQNQLTRIGVRYINRFDIPCGPNDIVNFRDYLKFGSTEPEMLNSPVRQYVVQVNSGIQEDGLSVNLLSSAVESPLINHVSISLDMDVFKDHDLPQTDEGVWALLALIRDRKDAIFEECITDATRELIS